MQVLDSRLQKNGLFLKKHSQDFHDTGGRLKKISSNQFILELQRYRNT